MIRRRVVVTEREPGIQMGERVCEIERVLSRSRVLSHHLGITTRKQLELNKYSYESVHC